MKCKSKISFALHALNSNLNQSIMLPFAKQDRFSSVVLESVSQRKATRRMRMFTLHLDRLGGRYLSVFFIYKPARKIAVIISARDMTEKERKAYGRK